MGANSFGPAIFPLFSPPPSRNDHRSPIINELVLFTGVDVLMPSTTPSPVIGTSFWTCAEYVTVMT